MEELEYFPIDVERTSWAESSEQLSQLRHDVFVDEQGVPKQDEFDGKDDDAVHWIAFGSGRDVLGCARLSDGKVGRMAVYKPQRHKGVGSALMRNIIRFAAANKMENLQLNAQSHAIPFYENVHFVVDGDEFIEAGLPHRHMTLSLERYIEHREISVPEIDEADREHILLDSAAAFHEQTVALIKLAHRQIKIFSKQLDEHVYGGDDVFQALLEFASAHANTEIHILVRNAQPLVQNGHQLLHLCHRLSSRVEIRTLGKAVKTFHIEFMLSDENGVIYNQSNDRYDGYAVPHSPLKAKELIHDFDDMWQHSEPDPELRSLPI